MLLAHENIIWLGEPYSFDLNIGELNGIALDPHYQINRTVINSGQIYIQTPLCQGHRGQLFAPTPYS
jgi:hypothetical protein